MDPGMIFSALSTAIAALFAGLIKALYDRLGEKDRALADLKSAHEDAMKTMRDLHALAITQMQALSEKAVEDVRQSHVRELSQRDMTIEKLEAKNDQLNTTVDRNNDALDGVATMLQKFVDMLGSMSMPKPSNESSDRKT